MNISMMNSNPFSLAEKVILITGASSGLGRQCAIRCSEAGAKIILVARDDKRLRETKESLFGEGHLCFSLDIVQTKEIAVMVQEAVAQTGKVSGLIHAAGIDSLKPFSLLKVEDYHRDFAVNVFAGFEIARILSQKKHVSSLGASFIFMASVLGKLGQKGRVIYCSSKGAVLGGIKAMALELAPKKIRVNAVSPAIIKTEMVEKLFTQIPRSAAEEIGAMHPLGFGEPDDVAFLCQYLLADSAKWITGADFIVDGGYSIA